MKTQNSALSAEIRWMVVIMTRAMKTTITIYAIVFIVVILGFFLFGIEKSPINIWAFSSLLFSLFVSLLGILFLLDRRRGNVFLTSGFSSLISLYQIIVIASLFFKNLFKENVGGFAFMEILIFAIFLILAVLLYYFSLQKFEKDMKTIEKLQNGEFDNPKRGGI